MSEMKRLLLLMEDAEEKDSDRKDRDDIGNKKDKEEEEDLTRTSIAGTGEEQEILAYVRKHYPEAPSTQAAFIKFVIKSLIHSYEDSERQAKQIQELEKKIEELEKKSEPEEEIFEPEPDTQDNNASEPKTVT